MPFITNKIFIEIYRRNHQKVALNSNEATNKVRLTTVANQRDLRQTTQISHEIN